MNITYIRRLCVTMETSDSVIVRDAFVCLALCFFPSFACEDGHIWASAPFKKHSSKQASIRVLWPNSRCRCVCLVASRCLCLCSRNSYREEDDKVIRFGKYRACLTIRPQICRLCHAQDPSFASLQYPSICCL